MVKLRNIIIALACLVGFVAAESRISLYEHSNHEGDRVYLRSSGRCVNVPNYFNDKASSVDTYNTCMTVYDHANCVGDYYSYSPGRGNHLFLPENGFNDKISSVRAC